MLPLNLNIHDSFSFYDYLLKLQNLKRISKEDLEISSLKELGLRFFTPREVCAY